MDEKMCEWGNYWHRNCKHDKVDSSLECGLIAVLMIGTLVGEYNGVTYAFCTGHAAKWIRREV